MRDEERIRHGTRLHVSDGALGVGVRKEHRPHEQNDDEEVLAQVDEAAGRCPEYDKKVALDCVNAINQMQCQAIYDDAWPAACNQVCPDGAAQQSPLDTGDAG